MASGIIGELVKDWNLYKTNQESVPNKKIFAGTFLLFLFCWLPYYLAFYPGIVTWDAEWQVEQALGLDAYSNHQPWIHTLLLKACCWLGKTLGSDVNTGVGIAVAAQLVFLVGVFSYMIYTFFKEKVKKGYLIFCTLLFAIMPIYAYYSVILWKDVAMGGIVLLFSLFIWKCVVKEQIKIPLILGLFVTGTLMLLLRSNGFYAYLLCVPFLVIFLKKARVRIAVCCILSVTVTMLVKGPIMTYYNAIQPDTIEGFAIPAQHIARVVYDNKKLTEEQTKCLEQIIDIDEIPGAYNAELADPIKMLVRQKGNQQYLKKNKAKYFKLWVELGLRYPKEYIKAQIDQTRGYWSPIHFLGDNDRDKRKYFWYAQRVESSRT